MTAYERETTEKRIGGRTVCLVSLTPRFSAEEKRKVKAAVERRLYEIFCKYPCAELLEESDGMTS